MKILIIRFSSIGDIVLTTPVVRCLKQQKPETTLHYLTKQAYANVLASNPFIDKLFFLRDDLDEVIEQLKDEHYDIIVDLHNNLRTLRVKKALNVKAYSFSKLNVQKWVLTNFRVNMMPDNSIVDRYLDTVKPLGVHNDGKGLDYYLPPAQEITHADIPMSHWSGYIGCVIGGSYNTKKLPVGQWQKFCAEVQYPVILLGGPEDKAEGDQIAAQDPIKIYNACGKFSLNESAELVQRARVIVSNDTGLMHVAAAYQKPIISLWGNTSPEMGMFPYYGYNNLKSRIAPQSIIVENKQLSCHPCSKMGYARCPRRHFKCMSELDMVTTAQQAARLWAMVK